MAESVDRLNPSFVLFPVQNNRTGYKPFGLPMILVEPYKRNADGAAFADAACQDLEIKIEDAPESAIVAGHEHIGVVVPTLERFVLPISNQQLISVKVLVSGREFFDPSGTEITFAEAKEGDVFEYTTINGGISDTLPYFPDADYYDLSIFEISTGSDLPLGRYNFVYSCTYNTRLFSSDGELLCIDGASESIARFEFLMNHPGEVHNELISRAPPLYFDGPVDDDPTVDFFRPFADTLQDIFDEQAFIEGINWIDRIPPTLIPYLAYLIGWDLPYLPGNLATVKDDNIRRTILRNAVKLQKLKGSRQALQELFEIIGFTVELISVWWTSDGAKFHAPNEPLPIKYADQQITISQVCRLDPLATQYVEPGFGEFDAPLLHRPTANFSVLGYLVQTDSAADLQLQTEITKLLDDPDVYSDDVCAITQAGFVQTDLSDVIPDAGVLGFSEVLVDRETGKGVDDLHINEEVINKIGVSYDRETNVASVVFDHYQDFDKTKIYLFASYQRQRLNVPDAVKNLQSNRFDINISFKDGSDVADLNTFTFLLDQIFKIKAFHSLLRKIRFNVDLTEVYNVQDYCLSGRIRQDPDFDHGQLQVPPAIIPEDAVPPGECDDIADVDLGFKDEDLELRDRVIEGLEREHAIWKEEDVHREIPTDTELAALQGLSAVPISTGEDGSCGFTQLGQDRIINDPDVDFDHNEDDREKLCELAPDNPDYCYKGRVKDTVDIQKILTLNEHLRCKPCKLSMGYGIYWIIPYQELTGEIDPDSLIPNTFEDACDPRPVPVSPMLNKALCDYRNPPDGSLHYGAEEFINLDSLLNREFLSIRRPSLEIEKESMHLPGHRFVSMAHLLTDFIHPDYKKRPWDFNYDCKFDPITLNPLNAGLNLGSDGDEYLSFDVSDLDYVGNGNTPDISSFGNHTAVSFQITHSIYTTAREGHAAIEDGGTMIRTIEDSICIE